MVLIHIRMNLVEPNLFSDHSYDQDSNSMFSPTYIFEIGNDPI